MSLKMALIFAVSLHWGCDTGFGPWMGLGDDGVFLEASTWTASPQETLNPKAKNPKLELYQILHRSIPNIYLGIMKMTAEWINRSCRFACKQDIGQQSISLHSYRKTMISEYQISLVLCFPVFIMIGNHN